MKKKMLKTGILLGVSIFSLVSFQEEALANNTVNKETNINLSEIWEEVKQEDGVKVYFTLVEENGNKFLKIKFENTTSSLINFSWTLKNNSEVIVEKRNKIEAGKSIEIYDASMLIPFRNGDSFQNYSILISKK